MTAPIEFAAVGRPALALADCGLCTHPAHNTRECSTVNDHGQCCCWWYMPAAEYEARCAA